MEGLRVRVFACLLALANAWAQGTDWESLTPEAVVVSYGSLAGMATDDSATPAALALHEDVLALRVLPDSTAITGDESSSGAVDLFFRRAGTATPVPTASAGQQGSGTSTSTSSGVWEFAQRVLPPPDARGHFAPAIRLGDSTLVCSMTTQNGGVSGAVAIYRLMDATFQLEQTLALPLLDAAPSHDMLQLSSTGDLLAIGSRGTSDDSSVQVYVRQSDSGWELRHTLNVTHFEVSAISLSPSGAWLAAAGWRPNSSSSTQQNRTASVHLYQNHGLLDSTAEKPFIHTAEVNVTGDVMNTNVLALAMTDNMMAVGAGSNISVYAVTTLLNWSEEDSFVFANATAAGYTLALENHMLLIGGATVVSAHERQWPYWPNVFELPLPEGTSSSGATPPAQVEQDGMSFAILMLGIPGRPGSLTYLDTSPAYPNGIDTTTSPEGNTVKVMLRMTGLDMQDLTEQRRLYLRQGIANVSLANESYTDNVDIEFRFFYGQVFASVAVTVPSGYDRVNVAFDLFDNIRFGQLNRVLIAKDPFFETVQLSASSGTNPLAFPTDAPTPAPTPAPTYEPAPLIQTIDKNSTRDSNRYIKTTKEAFDENPPERTSSSIITFSCIGGGSFFLLACLLLICRKVVMSRMLMREVRGDKEWEYSPYDNAKPRLQVLAKAQLAIAKMQEETVYRKYYHLEEEPKTVMSNVGKMGMALNAFMRAAPPKEARVKVKKATTDVIKINRAAMAFKSAGVDREKSRSGGSRSRVVPLGPSATNHPYDPVVNSSLEIELS